MRTSPALLALLSLSCARSGPAPDASRPELRLVVGPDLPGLCLSPVAESEARLSRAERSTLDAARVELSRGQVPAAVQEGGEGLPEHPAADVIRGAAAVLEGRAEEARATFRDLANTWRADACVQQAAAYTSIQAGQLEFARPYLKEALALAPDDPDVALLAAIVQVTTDGDAEGALARLRPVAEAWPELGAVRAWTGRLLLQRGDADLALPHLEAAAAQGVELTGALVLATRLAGDLDGYLSIVGAAPPLPVDVRDAEVPSQAYVRALGIEPGVPRVATIHTSMGPLRCELFWQVAPLAVGNFVGLARGGTPWLHPETGELHEDELYPGTVFHRVIPGFMIQGGDVTGTGAGGPGYAFPDEVHPSLSFDRPGRLAMANSGPGTNGSQWFITEAPVSHLDGKHTIFGQCDARSVELVRAIAQVPTGELDKPLTPVEVVGIEFASTPGFDAALPEAAPPAETAPAETAPAETAPTESAAPAE